MRNKEKYPKIILLNSDRHYPERYCQVTEEEAADLEKNWRKYDGCFSYFDNLKYLYDEGKEDRTISINEVDVLPKEIKQYCEYQ